jgi:hypothetical protein
MQRYKLAKICKYLKYNKGFFSSNLRFSTLRTEEDKKQVIDQVIRSNTLAKTLVRNFVESSNLTTYNTTQDPLLVMMKMNLVTIEIKIPRRTRFKII